VSVVDPDLPYMVVAHVALHKLDVRAFLGGVNGLKTFCLKRLAFYHTVIMVLARAW
jgi:hypothetical protein